MGYLPLALVTIGLFSIINAQQYTMVSMVTDGNGAPLYAQMTPVVSPAVEEPVLVAMDNGEATVVDARRNRMFFRTADAVINPYATAAATTAAPPPQLTASNGYKSGSSFLRISPAPARFLPNELAEGVAIPQIPGVAGVDYPIFSQALTSSFHCQDQSAPGYYADVEAKCQVFHICQQEIESPAFLCPNGTIFNEKYSVCDWWYNVRCEKPAPIVNGYGYTPAPVVASSSYATPPPPTPAPIVQSYSPMVQTYFMQQQPEAVPAVVEVVEDVPATEEALRMFQANRLRANRFRNGAGYQQQVVAVEEVVTEIPTEAPVVTEAAAGYGGRRLKSNLRSNNQRPSSFFRFSSGGLRNGAAAYNTPIEEPVTEVVSEIATEAPVAAYGGAIATANGVNGGGRRLKNNLRFNNQKAASFFRFNGGGLRNGGGSYDAPAAVAPVEEVVAEVAAEVEVAPPAPVVGGYGGQRLRTRLNALRNDAYGLPPVVVAAEEPAPEAIAAVSPPAGYAAVSNGNGGRKFRNQLRGNTSPFRFNNGLRSNGYGQQPVTEAAVTEVVAPEVIPEVAPEVVEAEVAPEEVPAVTGYAAPAAVIINGDDVMIQPAAPARFNPFRSAGGYYGAALPSPPPPEAAPAAETDEATVVVVDESGRTAASIKGAGAFRVNHKGQVRLTPRARSMLRSLMRPQRMFRSAGKFNTFLRNGPARAARRGPVFFPIRI